MIFLTIFFCCIFGVAAIGLAICAAKQGNRYEKLRVATEKLYQENDDIMAAIRCNQTELSESQVQLEKTRVENNALTTRKQELTQDIADNMRQVEQLKESFETTEEQFRRNYMNERKNWVEARQDEYLRMQEDFTEQFKEENHRKLEAARQLEATLAELSAKVSAATEVAKEHAKEEDFVAYHSLQLEEKALNDIQRLQDLVPDISPEAGEAVAKIIWKVYYEKPTMDLVGRVVGSNRRTGIYRITNTKSSRCYVGQAVDIGDRWRQHIKRALNAEPRTQNKLYPAMYKEGLQNFTFEIVEECSRDKLNEREDYWQDFYHAKDYGYSIK